MVCIKWFSHMALKYFKIIKTKLYYYTYGEADKTE